MKPTRVLIGSVTSALAVLLVAVAANVAAADPLTAAVTPATGPSTTLQTGKISSRLSSAKGKATVFVELAAKSAVDASDEKPGPDARKAAESAKAEIDSVAARVVGDLRSRDAGTEVLYRTANGVAGVTVVADAAKIREIAARPDVRSVRPAVPVSPTNSSAVQLTNTLKQWQQTGKLGDGVKIGIIDGGIDYTHADFGGAGTVEAFKAIDRTKIDPSYFPTAKVVGGYDFAGDDYDANNPDSQPRPDPNPLDCAGHGTHVAGTAAGLGVNADGSTFKDDYTKLTPEALNAMRIGPGVAPKASLYALRIFGCRGSSYLSPQAMDWALDPNGDGDFSDHLDVVNLSLGTSFGAPDSPDSLFVRKLNRKGVLTVFSAGNDGDLYDAAGSPGTTPESLAVASTRDASIALDATEVVSPAAVAGQKAGQYSLEYKNYDSLDLTRPVVALSDKANADGCETFSDADKAAVAGKFAWLEWDDNAATRKCGSAARTSNAQNAGAAGVVLTSSLRHFDMGISGDAGLPAIQLTASSTDALRPALATGTLQLRLAGSLRDAAHDVDPSLTDTPSSFTSRGVRGPALKPDVAAPGDTITSALSGSGNGNLVSSGTSMAAPHVTGIAALVREAHPSWTPEEVKAAVMNTAGADVRENGKTYAPQRVGSGRVDAKAAVDNEVLAITEDDHASVSASFGTVEAADRLSLSKTIKVVNHSDRAVSYDVAYNAITHIPGVRYELSTSAVQVAPHGTGLVQLTLKIDDPAALRKTADPTIELTQVGQARQFLADASGRVVFTPKSGSAFALRVPVYSAPRPVARIGVSDSVRLRGTESTLAITGRGLDQSEYRSLVSVLELQASSPRLPECRPDVTSNCTVNDTAKGADLRYVGVASTAPQARKQGKPQDALLAFGVATWGKWANLGRATTPAIEIDTTGDGKADFQTYATTADGTDVMVAVTQNLATQENVDVQPLNGHYGDVDTNVFDTDVVVLPVKLTALGIDPAKDSAKISYTAITYGYTSPATTDGVVDTLEGNLTYDALKPGLWVEGNGGPALSFVAKPGTGLAVHRDPSTPISGNLLVLHHHNATGDRTDVVKVRES